MVTSSSPCEAAAKASMDCLEKNDYKRSQCLHIFEAYKECKKTWVRLPSDGPRADLTRSVAARPEEGGPESGQRRLSGISGTLTKDHNTVTRRTFLWYPNDHLHDERSCFHFRYDPGPKSLSPNTLSTTFIISMTFSSSHDFPAICTPMGNPAIASTS